MLKWYRQKASTFNGLLYRERDVILDEKLIEIVLKVPAAIVVSSWRSLEEQKVMVAKGASQTLESNHRRGMAADIVNWNVLDAELEKVGLVNDISWDKNHYTPEGEHQTALKYPLINTFEKSDSNQYNPIDMKPTKKLAEAYKDLVRKDAGDNLNEKEQDDFAEKIQELKDKSPVEVIKEVPVEVIKEVIKEVPVEVIKEVVVEKVVEIPATEEQVKVATRSYIQKFLDLLFKL